MPVPQKLKIELPYDPVILLLTIHPKDMKAGLQRDICTSMFVAFSQQPKGGNNLNIHQQMNG